MHPMKNDIGRVFVTGNLSYNSPVGEQDIIFKKKLLFKVVFFENVKRSRDPVPSITSRLVTAACRVYSLAMA